MVFQKSRYARLLLSAKEVASMDVLADAYLVKFQ